MSHEVYQSRSIIGATNLILLDGEIYRAQQSSPQSAELWVLAQATAHTTFGCPTSEEMVGIKSQYAYWQRECPERARRVSDFLREINIHVPELGIIENE